MLDNQPTTREVPQINHILVLAVGLLIGILVTMLAINYSNRIEASREAERTVTGPAQRPIITTFDYQGKPTRIYVFADPLTGVQHLIDDKGGICVRVDQDGNPIGGLDEQGE